MLRSSVLGEITGYTSVGGEPKTDEEPGARVGSYRIVAAISVLSHDVNLPPDRVKTRSLFERSITALQIGQDCGRSSLKPSRDRWIEYTVTWRVMMGMPPSISPLTLFASARFSVPVPLGRTCRGSRRQPRPRKYCHSAWPSSSKFYRRFSAVSMGSCSWCPSGAVPVIRRHKAGTSTVDLAREDTLSLNAADIDLFGLILKFV